MQNKIRHLENMLLEQEKKKIRDQEREFERR